MFKILQAFTLNVVEVDTNIVVLTPTLHRQINSSLINSRVLRQLLVLLEVPRLIRCVLMDDIDLPILEVPQSAQHDIPSSHPNLLPHLSPNVTQPGHPIEAKTLTPTISKHSDNLGILLAVLLELKLALCLLVVVLSTTTVLTAFSWGRRVEIDKEGKAREGKRAQREEGGRD